jgi:hypothetical protein
MSGAINFFFNLYFWIQTFDFVHFYDKYMPMKFYNFQKLFYTKSNNIIMNAQKLINRS